MSTDKKYVWLIECRVSKTPTYWDGKRGWTTDPNKAFHYRSCSHALDHTGSLTCPHCLQFDYKSYKVTEHLFI